MGFKRVLWLSFQEELITQTAMAFIKEKFYDKFYNHVKSIGFLDYIKQDGLFALNDFKLGCIKGDIFKPDANVVMGSVMTVARRLDRLPPDYFDCIICDEAHLFGSKSAVNTINHFTPKLLLGCTATATRSDGMMLGDIFDKITFEYGLDSGIKDKWSAELDAIKIKTTTSLDSIHTLGGDFNQKELSNQINTLSRNQQIVDSWKKYCGGRQTIAFCTNIQHAIDLAEQFKLNNINSVAVSSDEELTPLRSHNIEAFKQGKIDVITNVSILVAGFDHPDTGCAIMASPTKSLTKYLQAVGRAARLKSDNYVSKYGQKAIIIDVVDVTSRHNLVNAWELDKQKPIEDRTFLSQEKKDLLILDRIKRSAKLDHNRLEDEFVNLLRLPQAKISNSIRMQEQATEAQLKWVESLGYDVNEINYTKEMCSKIIMDLPCTDKQLSWLKCKKYDCNNRVVSRGEYEAAFKETTAREQKIETDKRNNKAKNNSPFKF